MDTSASRPGSGPLTVRVARWSATHPWRAIGIWLAFVAICFAVGQAAGTRKATDVQLGVGESGRAARVVHAAGLDQPMTEHVLVTARGGTFDAAQARRAADDAARRLRALPQVAHVDEPQTAKDGKAVLVTATMAGDPAKAADHVQPLRDATAATQRAFPQLRVEETGGASISNGVNSELGTDFGKASKISLPVTLLILLVAFGAIIAAGVPVLLALSAVAAAIGLAGVASHLVPDAGTAAEMILLMGMAVGVDYSLFYLKRDREARRAGHAHLDAIEIAARTSGHSVIVSGVAVIVSMAGLYLANDGIFASLATGSILVVAIAVLGSLTVLPALLAKLGRHIDRPRVPLFWRWTNRDAPPRLWPALLRPALRHPGRTLAVSAGALVLLALPALGMTLRQSGPNELPKSIPAVRTYHQLAKQFPAEQTSHQIVVSSLSQDSAAVTSALRQLATRAAGETWFAVATPPVIRTSANGTVHTMTLDVPFATNSANAKHSLHELRDVLLPATVGTIPHASYAVGGDVAANVDYVSHMWDRLPWVIGFVLTLTFLMMAVTFRSVVVALSTIAVNLLSAGAAFGILTLVFQHSWADGLLRYHSTGAIVSWIPLFLFAVLFGLSMDYHVFVVGRIREAAERGLSAREAVREGITRSAGVVTSAAAVMVSVFLIFASLSMVEFKQLGVGLAAAVLVDAVVVRIVVLPSLMALLGRANWWPSHLSRREESNSPQTAQPVRA